MQKTNNLHNFFRFLQKICICKPIDQDENPKTHFKTQISDFLRSGCIVAPFPHKSRSNGFKMASAAIYAVEVLRYFSISARKESNERMTMYR